VLSRHDGRNPLTHRTLILRPLDSQWAAWHPREADGTRHSVIDFDASRATFGAHPFRNVTAVGWLATRALAKTTLAVSAGQSPHQAIALKWYAFRCDAVVERPERPGHAVSLAPSGERLWLSGAVTFRQWESLRRIGVTNQFCRGLGDLGYAIFHDGAIADMERAERTFHIDEPVAAIAWLDAVAWCNMLSEFEGLRPAYYADRECTRVLRRALDRSQVAALADRPTVYWDRSAAGFRLPTRAESPGGAVFCWEGPESGAVLYIARNRGPGGEGVVSRQPGSQEFAEPDEPSADLKERVLAQLHSVRLPVGLATVEDDDPFGVFAARRAVERARNDRFMGKITPKQLDRVIAENPLPDFAQRKPYALEVGTTEVSYRLWNSVRRWALTRGYRFNYRGDMGSMRCLFAGAETFAPDHPVTHVSWHDALIWCNALSELTSRRPVYYIDAQRTVPYRRAVTLRLDMYDGEGYPVPPDHVRRMLGQEGRIAPGQRIDTNSAELVYMDTSADGYRLPLVQEFDRILAAVRGPESPRGQTLAAADSPRTTRSVVQATPDANGLCDLSGGVLEWAWSPLESYLNSLGQYSLNGYGCFSMTEPQTAANRRRYQDVVYNARPYYGVRVVRRAD
jgi:formylglycine-generating enzyme required for sulfatase activity